MEIGGLLTQGGRTAIRLGKGRHAAGFTARRPGAGCKEEGTMTMRDILLACALLYAMELWLLLVCRVDGRFLLAFVR